MTLTASLYALEKRGGEAADGDPRKRNESADLCVFLFFFDAEFKGCQLLGVTVDDTQILNVRLLLTLRMQYLVIFVHVY